MREHDKMTDPNDNCKPAQPDTTELLRDLEAVTARFREAFGGNNTRYEQPLPKDEVSKNNSFGEDPTAHEAVADSYVLVLVDAHSHNLKENYVQGGESGGAKAAAVLKEEATEHLSSHLSATDYRIEIRVYANLKTIPFHTTEQCVVGKPPYTKSSLPRTLGRFAAGFSCNDIAVDYIDVAGEQVVEQKICGLFKMHIKKPQCQHILFAASGSPQYRNILGEHLKFADKITLVQRGDHDTSLLRSGLRTAIFERVFESFPGINAIPKSMGKPSTNPYGTQPGKSTGLVKSTVNSPQRGFSRTQFIPIPTPTVSLPTPDSSGKLPVNSAGHRIDTHMKAPTHGQWNEYHNCVRTRKLCTMFHVGQGCSNSFCGYDHRPISPNERYCLRYAMRAWPCRNGGACRDLDCIRGHLCHREACSSKSEPCRMPSGFHGVDLKVAEWIAPKGTPEGSNEDCGIHEDLMGWEERWGTHPGVLIDIGPPS